MEYDKESLAGIVKTVAQETLVSLLKQITGSKDLVISPQLISSLDLVCGVGQLKAAGVDKIYKLEAKASTPGNSANCCFLVRNDIKETNLIAELISADKVHGKPNVNYYIIYVPGITRLCDSILESQGIYGYVTTMACPLYFIPLDVDLLSLEQHGLFASLFLCRDQTNLLDVARALAQLQSLVGPVPSVYGQGKYSAMTVKIMKELVGHDVIQRTGAYDSVITDLLIVDREIDFVSCLLSPLNYEGLLDEEFEIKCGKVTLPPEVTKTPQGLRQVVHSSEAVFSGIRDAHLSSAFSRLKEKGTGLKMKHDEMRRMDLSAIKDFVQTELKNTQEQYRSLSLHVSACEVIMERKKEDRFVEQLKAERNIVEGHDMKEVISFIEEGIISQHSMTSSLRLLCLLSIANDGLSSKEYRNLVKLFLQSFGHKHIVTFYNLKRLGLFYEQPSSSSMFSPSASNPASSSLSGKASSAVMMGTSKMLSVLPNRSQFKTVAKRLNLIPEVEENKSYDLKNPKDAGFVFGGTYIAVVCRLVELLILRSGAGGGEQSNSSNSNSDDLLKLLPGDRLYKRASQANESPSHRKVILVFFLGGVTFAEVSALRFLAGQRGFKVVVATTSVINGKQLINYAIQ